MEIRKVSSKAQITLPKEFAGQLVSIEKIAEGVIQVKTGKFVPHSEEIFHSEKYKKRLEKFDQWMEEHAPEESNIDQLEKEKTS